MVHMLIFMFINAVLCLLNTWQYLTTGSDINGLMAMAALLCVIMLSGDR